MKPVLKYTFTDGWGASGGAAVGCAQECLFLLSEFEVYGNILASHTEERQYQQRYAYYRAGNPFAKYRHDILNATTIWWLRSRHRSSTDYYCGVPHTTTLGSGTSYKQTKNQGVAPGFCV